MKSPANLIFDSDSPIFWLPKSTDQQKQKHFPWLWGSPYPTLCGVSCWLYFYIYLPTPTSPEEDCEPGPWDRQWGMVTISANTCWAPALRWDDWDKMWDLEAGVMHSVWGFLTPLLSGLRQLHLPIEAHLLICKNGHNPRGSAVEARRSDGRNV